MESMTESATTDRYLDDLAHLIAREGLSPFESDIARLVVRLRASGICSVAVDVLADHRAPDVVRQRAFAIATGCLGQSSTRPITCAA